MGVRKGILGGRFWDFCEGIPLIGGSLSVLFDFEGLVVVLGR